MNKRNARKLSIKEARKILPRWFVEMEDNVLSILKNNDYNDFKRISIFLTNSLTHIVKFDENNKPINTEIKHVKVEVQNKGINAGYQHITIVEYIKLREEECFWTISRSMKVKLRKKMTHD